MKKQNKTNTRKNINYGKLIVSLLPRYGVLMPIYVNYYHYYHFINQNKSNRFLIVTKNLFLQETQKEGLSVPYFSLEWQYE